MIFHTSLSGLDSLEKVKKIGISDFSNLTDISALQNLKYAGDDWWGGGSLGIMTN